MVVNNRLLNNPRFQKMPKSEREWVQYHNELAKWVLRVARLGDGSMLTASDVTISGLDQMPGRVPSERSLPMADVGNVKSIQDVISSPLTASDGGGTATISIASHTLATPSGDIIYNAGSVTGLSFSTTYYVYADDDDYEGGAVTYQATTDAAVLVGDLGRYFVGQITTGISQEIATITNVTQANPGEVTVVSNPFTNGDEVDIAGVVGMTELNGNTYTVANGTGTTFELSGTDTTGFTAYVSDGTATRNATTPSGGFGGGGGGIGGQLK